MYYYTNYIIIIVVVVVVVVDHLHYKTTSFGLSAILCTFEPLFLDHLQFKTTFSWYHCGPKLEGPLYYYFDEFLALLDSVSRAHGVGLLSVVRRPSVRRPCRNYL